MVPNSASSSRRAVEVPAAAGGVGVERDLRRRERAEIEPRHVGDAEVHRFQRVDLLVVRPASLQRAIAASTKIVELGLAQHAVVDDDGMRGRGRSRIGGVGASTAGALGGVDVVRRRSEVDRWRIAVAGVLSSPAGSAASTPPGGRTAARGSAIPAWNRRRGSTVALATPHASEASCRR